MGRKKTGAQIRKKCRERVRKFRARKKALGFKYCWVKTPPKYDKPPKRKSSFRR